MIGKIPLATVLLSATLLWGAEARATPLPNVFIGLQQAGVNGGAVTQAASGWAYAWVGGLAYGSFSLDSISATGYPILPLPQVDSNSLNVSSLTPGTLAVYVSQTGVTFPVAAAQSWFSSTFTSNHVPAGWTVAEATYLDPTNTPFTVAGATLLGSATFTGAGTVTAVEGLLPPAPPGGYAITEVYTVTTAASVDPADPAANSTIDLAASVPEPASFALLASGLVVLGLVVLGLAGRRRRA